MKNGASRRLIAFFLFLLSLMLLASYSFAETREDISNSKAAISGNQKKIKELEGRQSELRTELERLKSQKEDTASYIQKLDEKQKELEASSAVLMLDMEETGKQIEEAEKKLAGSYEELNRQKESMGIRIRYMYEFSKYDLLELLLQSDSLAELLNQVEYIQKVSQYDRDRLEDFKRQAADVEQKKTELESRENVLAEQQKTLEAEIYAVEELQQEKKEQINAFEKEISDATVQSRQLSSDVEKLNAAIKEEEQRIARIEAELLRKEEEARKKALEQQKEYKTRSIGDLNLLWPVPSSARVTSNFGDREAPVEGASTKHKGIDIGASSGEKILAAEKGTVVIAAYSQSAGNYIMLSHGGGIYTVYMHMSEIRVSEGEEVARGAVIGTVGSTGYSTGPHLHFGLRINGEYTDPLNCVSYGG